MMMCTQTTCQEICYNDLWWIRKVMWYMMMCICYMSRELYLLTHSGSSLYSYRGLFEFRLRLPKRVMAT
jgi:hypothetical protein